MNQKVSESIEMEEVIQKLRDAGFEELVEKMLLHEDTVYTKRGRLNKSGACRALEWKTKRLEDALAACREILFTDMGH